MSLLADVAVSTFAVGLTWLLLGLLLSGIGVAVLRLLAIDSGGDPWTAPLWVGLATLLAYLQLWNVGFAVTWLTWALPLAAAVAGAVLLVRRRPAFQPKRRGLVTGAVAAILAVGLANRALGAATDYDLGLYHLGLIEYAKRYATIPGLANLQTRFGASDPHLLLVSLLDRGPWAGGAWHLVNGFLVSLLLFELAARIAPVPGRASFTRRLALILLAATAVAVGDDVGYRLSSPNLDLACFVLVAAGMLYLVDSVESGFRAGRSLTAVATLASASATRPLYWLWTAFACALVLAIGRKGHRIPLVRAARLLLLPAALAAGWLARQAVLSGYPLYPLTVAGLPVDWRVPASVVDYANRWTSSWARWPGQGPDQVLSSWHWLHAFWLKAMDEDLDVVAPLALLGCLLPALLSRRSGARRTGTRPMLTVAVPSAVTLVIWFFEAPDPRFVLAPLWLLPAALLAWALPPLTRPSVGVLLTAVAGASALAAVYVLESAWFLPAALLLPVYLLGAVWAVGRPALAAPVAAAVALAVAAAGVGVVVYRQPHHLLSASGSGPFGVQPEDVPGVQAIETTGGLRLSQPDSAATGNDQCFTILVCTAELADPALHDVLQPLHLRGSGIGSGFSDRPRAVASRQSASGSGTGRRR